MMALEADKMKEPGHPILIVDDEEIVLVALRDTLLREGYQVVASPHAVHALSILKEQPFSVVVTSLKMPMVTGLEFLAEVMNLQPHATRILITAVLTINTVIDAINKGEIYRFIVKPWLREELLATVRNAVQRFELMSSNVRLQAETQAANAKLLQVNQQLEAQVAKVAEQNVQLQKLIDAKKDSPKRAVEAALEMLRVFHPTLAERTGKVHDLCQTIGKIAGLSEREKETLEISALIHDIGFIGLKRSTIKRWLESEV